MIDLQKFCDGSIREALARPWSRGEYTYATSGHIIVRVPRRDDVPDNPESPDALRLKWDSEKGEAVEIPDLPAPVMEPCMDCTGEDPEYIKQCEECDGLGMVRARANTKVGTMTFGDQYLEIIKVLPGYKFYPIECDTETWNKTVPSVFTFDGGDGLLMPVKV